MPPQIAERSFEDEYDRALCLIPRDVLDFVYATQPKGWARLRQQHHGGEVKERFLQRLAFRSGVKRPA